MKHLPKIFLSILILYFLQSCAAHRQEIELIVERKPMIDIPSGARVLYLPFSISSFERFPEESVNDFIFNTLEAFIPGGIVLIYPEHHSFAMNQLTHRRIVSDEAIDSGVFFMYDLQYIVTGIISFQERFYSGEDSNTFNPAYRADHRGAPGIRETSREWRQRIVTDLAFETNVEFIIYDVKNRKNIHRRKLIARQVFDEHQQHFLNRQREDIYRILLQDAVIRFTKGFDPDEVIIKREFFR